MKVVSLLCFLFVHVSLVHSLNNGVGLTPPMGWSTWCTDNGIIPCFNDYCNENEVKSIADAMASNGMQQLGYLYLNLDDCWAGNRTANGTITAEKSRFPSGTLKPLADYLHSKGFKLGLYTDVGNFTCRGNRPGSYGYYQQDANTYAEWGIDWVKMDWCDHPGQYNASQLYGQMRDALNATGRPMFFAICEWGLYEPWTWGPSTGNSWRVGPDHLPLWWTFKTSQDPGQAQGTANIIQHMAGLSKYASSGAWNDPDFLMTGEWSEGLIYGREMDYQTEFSFWCLFNAPLIVATDVRNMTYKQALLNSEAIAVNQDPLLIAGDLRVNSTDGTQVWSKPLSGNRWAVILYNSLILGTSPSPVTVTFNSQQLPGWPSSASSASIRDLWAHQNLGTFNGSFTESFVPHASGMYILSPVLQ